jgi:hypothetical protein
MVVSDINSRELTVYDVSDYTKPPQKLPPLSDEIRAGNNLTPTDWSPDGMFLSGTSGSALWVFSFAGQQFRTIGPTTGGGQTAQFLPDGRRLLKQTRGQLYLVDRMTDQATELLSLPRESIGAARFNSDWTYLYFLHGTQAGDVWLARLSEPAKPTEN